MAINATFDKPVYNVGETMTLTVKTTTADRDRFIDTPFTVHLSIAGTGDGEASASVRRQIADALVVVTDADRTWTQVSDDGVTAVFTAKA